MTRTNISSSLMFLEVTHPIVPRGKDAQRVIRSHVTRIQHQRRRESYRAKQCSHAKDGRRASGSGSSASSDDQHTPVGDHTSPESLSEPASSPDRSSAGSGLPFFNSFHPSQIKNLDARRLIRSHVTKWQHRRRRKEMAEAIDLIESTTYSVQTKPALEVSLPCIPVISSETLISKGAAEIQNVILDDSTNTVATAITSLGLDLRSIMAQYYYMALDVHGPEFEAHYCMKGVCKKGFLPLLFTDPALTCTILLIAAIHRIPLMGMKRPPTEVLQLRDYAITVIHHALQELTRACSDQLIFAVANLAIFEAVFGSIEVYDVHLEGLSRMLRLRGGLPNLGFQEYLQKVLLWYDSTCANLVGCKPYPCEWESAHEQCCIKTDPGGSPVMLH